MHPFPSRQKNENTVSSTSEEESIALPKSFIPGPDHVVCVRGKEFWEHEGNKKYRALIAQTTSKYEATSNKLEKTLIVSEIVESIRKANSSGNFVKRDHKTGLWVEVSDHFAREKVGQSFRDGLHSKYRSSTQAKKSRKRKLDETMNGNIDAVIRSNESVSRQIDEVTRSLQQLGPLATDATICTVLTRANSDILETIKRDGSLLAKFKSAASW
jgi:hypothetical protein